MDRPFALVIFVSLCCSLGWISSQDKYGCQKNDCAQVKCPVIENCNDGRFIQNGSLHCGCCNVCVKYLEHGDPCNVDMTNALPRKECGEGLMCDKSKEPPTCNYADTKCIKKHIEFLSEEEKTEGIYTMGAPKPDCDTFGDYEPVQCKEGMKCYCVDVNGDRIFGLGPHTEGENMNCTCSRDYESFKHHMKDPDEKHQFMRCTANGDYYHTQCTDDQCYCVDPKGVLTKGRVAYSKLDSLQCNDDAIQDFNTTCIEEYIETMKTIEELPSLQIGIELPSCDLDGSYSPVQCKGFECYCVNKDGKKAPQIRTIARHSEEARTMKCSCLREKTLLKESDRSIFSDILTQYKCMNNGNYLPIQCTTAVCFCVDDMDGYQIGPPNLVSTRRDLPCYKEEYEDLLSIIID